MVQKYDRRSQNLVGATLVGVEVNLAVRDEDTSISLGETCVIGREERSSNLVLDHPCISRQHARILRDSDHWLLEDLRSTNGTYLNGRRVLSPVRIEVGDRLDIGPFSYEFTGDRLERSTRIGSRRVSAEGVSFEASRGLTSPTRILNAVDLCIEPNEFVCILGPSGSGKSTLLDLLAGRRLPGAGVIRVNGLDLHSSFEALKQGIAHVPQHDVLHIDLTVERALTYTARLRLPEDTANDEVARAVDEALIAVQLDDRRSIRIRDLSGGQRRRASLANEIVCRPQILFIDEATSGLDEQTDLEMMRLFRRLADRGMTVICITHNLANVERTAHLVAILAAGGVLAFVGKPIEALEHFEVSDLGRIYKRLSERPNDDWQDDFLASRYHFQYVADRLQHEPAESRPPSFTTARSGSKWAERCRQYRILSRRALELLFSDWRTFGFSLLSSIVIAIILVGVFQDTRIGSREEATLNFLIGTVAVWLGCNNAAKELVKEREIYRKERDARLDPLSYLSSRFTILALLALIQVSSMTWILHDNQILGFDLGTALGIQCLAAITGTCLGLLISALARSAEQASSLVPIALIPQIVLSGFVVSNLPTSIEQVSHYLISNYSVNRAIEAAVDSNWGQMWAEISICVAQSAVMLGSSWIALRRK